MEEEFKSMYSARQLSSNQKLVSLNSAFCDNFSPIRQEEIEADLEEDFDQIKVIRKQFLILKNVINNDLNTSDVNDLHKVVKEESQDILQSIHEDKTNYDR